MDDYEDYLLKSLTRVSTKASSPADDEFLIFGKKPRSESAMDAFVDEILPPACGDRAPWLDSTCGKPMGSPVRLGLADVLLDESVRAAERNPQQAEEMAVLSEWIASQPYTPFLATDHS
ncbi:MAG TPA: hypothetical protein VF173_37645 [Thermoanaerobaculia bacterium]|nr:hypothetical protein [Thermoanaerobaculia bacterium]